MKKKTLFTILYSLLLAFNCYSQNHCKDGQPDITMDNIDFFSQVGNDQKLRPYFCIDESSPINAPIYTGDHLKAYTWISTQLYPGSNGDIRSLYDAANIDWGTVPMPSYSDKCECSKSKFDAVKTDLQKEIQAISNIDQLFNSIMTYYISPEFILNTEFIAGIITTLALSDQPAVIHSSSIIEKAIFGLFTDQIKKVAGSISPYGPIAVSTLLNLSKTSNGGTVPPTIDAKASELENKLPDTFKSITARLADLRTLITADYSLYLKMGLYSGPITESQFNTLAATSSDTYRMQLYQDLLPLATSIVYYSPSDTDLGGGGDVYANASKWSHSVTNKESIITYLHYAGFAWSSKTNYQTTSIILTSNKIYNSGDLASGGLCANNLLNDDIYKMVFETLNLTYDDLLKFGISTFYQCSLCTGSECNSKCRPSGSSSKCL